MNKDDKPLIFLGSGGHAAVLADILLKQGREIVAVFSPHETNIKEVFKDIPFYKNDADLIKFDSNKFMLVNAIGRLTTSKARLNMAYNSFTNGFKFSSVISDYAYIAPSAEIEEGVHILPFAIIQSDAFIGHHSIVNSGAIIEHGCRIGRLNHIATGAKICGDVVTKDNVFIGAGSTVIQQVSIDENSVIGAGITIHEDIPKNTFVKPNGSLLKKEKIRL